MTNEQNICQAIGMTQQPLLTDATNAIAAIQLFANLYKADWKLSSPHNEAIFYCELLFNTRMICGKGDSIASAIVNALLQALSLTPTLSSAPFDRITILEARVHALECHVNRLEKHEHL